jgi:arsenite methyltransferase
MTEKDQLSDYSSTGHRLSNVAHLDAHYVWSQRTYEAMICAVGLQAGWHVLDAGCGSGSFLPLMADLVGPNGKIDAYDLAPENIAHVQAMVDHWDVAVEARVGSVTTLPYADDTFDAVWNANVTQYLTDNQVTEMLEEFVRVVKPGGVIAIKEVDDTALIFQPFNTFVWWRFQEQMGRKNPGWFRTLALPKWLRRAGLVEITYQSYWAEQSMPLSAQDRNFVAGGLKFWGKEFESLDLSDSDKQHGQVLQDVDSPDHPLNSPDFYFRSSYGLAVGRKPSSTT